MLSRRQLPRGSLLPLECFAQRTDIPAAQQAGDESKLSLAGSVGANPAGGSYGFEQVRVQRQLEQVRLGHLGKLPAEMEQGLRLPFALALARALFRPGRVFRFSAGAVVPAAFASLAHTLVAPLHPAAAQLSAGMVEIINRPRKT